MIYEEGDDDDDPYLDSISSDAFNNSISGNNDNNNSLVFPGGQTALRSPHPPLAMKRSRSLPQASQLFSSRE